MHTGGLSIIKLTGLLIPLALFSSGCSTMSNMNASIAGKFRNFYTNKPEVVGRQPAHLMPHKDALLLNGPVQSVSYFMTRPDFTGTQVTDEVHLEFNRAGYITKITGNNAKALKRNGFLKYADLPANTLISYDKDNNLERIESAEKSYRYEYSGGPEQYSEESGDLRSVVLTHVKNREQNYRTLDYMIYGDQRYMVLGKDNRKRDNTSAHIYEYDSKGRLHKVYRHKNNYPLDKTPSQSLSDPLRYRFELIKQIDYDNKGRINHVMTSERDGALISEDRISYQINRNLPRRLTNINGTGAQQYRIKYSDYELDKHDNWISRKVITTYRRGDKQGSDTRKITYFQDS